MRKRAGSLRGTSRSRCLLQERYELAEVLVCCSTVWQPSGLSCESKRCPYTVGGLSLYVVPGGNDEVIRLITTQKWLSRVGMCSGCLLAAAGPYCPAVLKQTFFAASSGHDRSCARDSLSTMRYPNQRHTKWVSLSQMGMFTYRLPLVCQTHGRVAHTYGIQEFLPHA